MFVPCAIIPTSTAPAAWDFVALPAAQGAPTLHALQVLRPALGLPRTSPKGHHQTSLHTRESTRTVCAYMEYVNWRGTHYKLGAKLILIRLQDTRQWNWRKVWVDRIWEPEKLTHFGLPTSMVHLVCHSDAL